MRILLNLMENMGKEHYLLVEKQLTDCHELSSMVTNGLEDGGSAIFHLLQGNYSLFARTTDNWREPYINFLTTHYNTRTVVEKMLEDSHVFYYHDSILTVRSFLIKLVMLLLITTLVTLVLTRNRWLFEAARMLYQFINSFYENQLYMRDNPPWIELLQNFPIDFNNSFTNFARRFIEKHLRMIAMAFYVFIQVLIWIFVFHVLLTGTKLTNYDALSYSKSIRYNWYPGAQLSLEMMKSDMDSLAAKLAHNIHSIADIQSRTSAHHDMAVQAVVDDLKRSLVHVFRRVH